MALRLALRPALLAALLWIGAPAAAQLGPPCPDSGPDDPGFQDDFGLFDCMPAEAPLATDPENASGMSVNAAWADFTTGREDVVIAYTEAGINWHTATGELAAKIYINASELPPPPCYPHPTNSDPRDCNGDGWYSAPDYAGVGPPIPDHNGNGILDAEDLIVQYSDGFDGFGANNENNGYVDDISGWDFYNGQNDPATLDTTYGHCNAQMQRAAAIANNGSGRAGICQRCMLLPMKGGAEALDRPSDLAQAWRFAADAGAVVIITETAALGYSTFLRQTAEDLWAQGVLIAESTNDFNSTDHQGGMFHPHTIGGNGMVPNTAGTDAANAPDPFPDPLSLATTTYRVRSGQTSWGTRNLLTVTAAGGSTSESTGWLGGLLGLEVSHGLDQVPPLSGPEVLGVLIASASDVDDPLLEATTGWPNGPGWDLQYGYGRPNAWRAMDAMNTGEIPPVAWIDSPRWFSLFDPTLADAQSPLYSQVEVRGSVQAPRLDSAAGQSCSWELQAALGAEPAELDFAANVVASGGCATPFQNALLGTLDLAALVPAAFHSAPFAISSNQELETTEQYTVTLRLRAKVVRPGEGDLVGEQRRTFFARHDETWKSPFPKYIGPGGESQAVLADLQGNGVLDIIFGDTDGFVHVVNPVTGEERPGFPVATDPIVLTKPVPGRDPGNEEVATLLAVGDIDRNGELWIVGASERGKVYVWNSEGVRRPGWPVALDTGVTAAPIPRTTAASKPEFTRPPALGAFASPTLFDLDEDGRLEILIAGWDGHVHVFDRGGDELPGWPVKVEQTDPAYAPTLGRVAIDDAKIESNLAIADLDGDGAMEIVVRSQRSETLGEGIQPNGLGFVFAYHRDGTPVAGWPAEMPTIVIYYGSAQEFITEGSNSPVSADVDGDGNDEVASSPVFSPTYLFDGDASLLAVFGPTPDQTQIASALADPQFILDGGFTTDAPVSFTTSGAFGRFGSPGDLGVLEGQLVYAQAGSNAASIITGLLTAGSGQPIENVERAYLADSGAPLDAVLSPGLAPGFPSKMQGLNFLGAPIFVDVTGDGEPEIVDGADSSALHAYTVVPDPLAGLPVPLPGDQAQGFPKFHTGWTLWSPAAGDLDSDGDVEVVSLTREGYLMVWETPGQAGANDEWWRYHHDEWNTGRYGTDTRPPGTLRSASWSPGGASATFIAPGDDWYTGAVAAYHAYFDGAAEPTVVLPSGPAGTVESIPVPPGTALVMLQAVDEAGNLGRRVELGATAASCGLLGLEVVPVLGWVALRRRLHSGVRAA